MEFYSTQCAARTRALTSSHRQIAARWDDERRRLYSDIRRLESDRAKLQFELGAMRAQKIAIGQHASPSTAESDMQLPMSLRDGWQDVRMFSTVSPLLAYVLFQCLPMPGFKSKLECMLSKGL